MPTDRHLYPMISEFTLDVGGLPVLVRISDWGRRADIIHVYHFEFRSPDGKPTAISETGYRSWFVTLDDACPVSTLEDLAREYCDSFRPDSHPDQLAFF